MTVAAPPAVLDALDTVRQRCSNVAAHVAEGRSPHFTVHPDRLDAAAEVTAAITRQRYPDLAVPPHSRWRHFAAGGVDRAAEVDAMLAGHRPEDAARARLDLTVVSVLLDAGAGAGWRYTEAETGLTFSRSEGLAVATLRAFLRGAFSAAPGDPARVDASVLADFDGGRLAQVFQVRSDNPLVGLEGRVAMLQRLGGALADPARSPAPRPGALLDALVDTSVPGSTALPASGGRTRRVDARTLFAVLRRALRDVPGGDHVRDGVALGDCWPHPAAGGTGADAGLVPFHKLTQWLAYSLAEPLERAGVRIAGMDALTGLPEYRNGGLLLDSGVLALRDRGAAGGSYPVGSELCVEWRALTVTLLDALAPRVRAALGTPDLPLASILEGGTWAAGRALATRLRDGRPPLAIASDGTVF